MRPEAEDCREPANHPTPEAASRHLEACAECAASASAKRLDRVWEATRLPESSPGTLDALWTRAAIELDRIEVGRRSGSRGRQLRLIPIAQRRRRIFTWVALTQAAVILIGVGISLARRGEEPTGPIPVAVQTPKIADPVDVGFDQTLLVRIDDDSHEVVLLDEPSASPSLADNSSHDLFNFMESNATP